MSSSSSFAVTRLISGILKDSFIVSLAGSLTICHIVLAVIVKFILPLGGPWNQTAIFTTKQLLAFGLMIYQTYWGFVYWFSTTTPTEPLMLVEDEIELYDGGVYLSKIVLGGLLWDIPAGFITPGGAVDTMMHLHHFGMLTLASISAGFWAGHSSDDDDDADFVLIPIFARYAPFFYGVIELSSIPLQVVDLFHPHKQPAWYKYHLQSPTLQTINEIARNSFALLYILIRLVYFPYVIIGKVLVDAHLKWPHPENVPYRLPIGIIVGFTVFFTALQIYWGTLILKQIAKVLKGNDGGDASGGEESGKKKAKIKSV